MDTSKFSKIFGLAEFAGALPYSFENKKLRVTSNKFQLLKWLCFIISLSCFLIYLLARSVIFLHHLDNTLSFIYGIACFAGAFCVSVILLLQTLTFSKLDEVVTVFNTFSAYFDWINGNNLLAKVFHVKKY